MQILQDLRSTALAVQEETKQRALIEQSDAYLALQAQIDSLLDAQKALSAHIPDSREEYEMDKKEVIAYLTENNLTEVDGFVVKTRAKNSVDTYAVLQAMDGDIDNLMLVANVTQAALTKFMKDNEGYRHLKSCIKEDGYTITDIILPTND